jgi:hypothetical protein
MPLLPATDICGMLADTLVLNTTAPVAMSKAVVTADVATAPASTSTLPLLEKAAVKPLHPTPSSQRHRHCRELHTR